MAFPLVFLAFWMHVESSKPSLNPFKFTYLHAGMDFNDTQPFNITMEAETTVVSAEIPILNDEINEAEEEFVVVLEVVSDTTNSEEFTTNVTVCRIPASDRKCRAECLHGLN